MTNPRLAERCVLLVDDNPADIALLMRALPHDDAMYRYITAMSAAEGLAQIVEVNPDIVLLDYVMPDADGFEFLEDLQAMRAPSAITPVVVMVTAQPDPRIAAALMRLGAMEYVAKSDVTRRRMDAVLFEARVIIEQREAAMRARGGLSP
jgi:CheY-like chemotaxis protein